MIPKIIHYCWFGYNQIPNSVQKCIDSWKKYCPDYTLKLWTEDNFDIHSHPYMEEAYQKRRWAFVSDLARLLIVYEHGGIYLDTDVELIASLDSVLDNTFFFAIEKSTNTIDGSDSIHVNTGLGFGSERSNIVLSALIREYDGCHFINENGEIDFTPCPHRNTVALEKFGFNGQNMVMRFQHGTIYSSEYFCPIDYSTKDEHITANSISVHHYDATWITKREKVRETMKSFIKREIYKWGGYSKVTIISPLSNISMESLNIQIHWWREEVAA